MKHDTKHSRDRDARRLSVHFNLEMMMNEATFQTFALHSLKFVCSGLNKRLAMHVSSSNEQSPVDGTGRPYDVGLLLDNAHLVGIEFKICENKVFPSWNRGQHETYLGLTGGSSIALPLYYAYNAVTGRELSLLYDEDAFIPLLEQTNVSTPKELPGQRPSMHQHEDMYQWLLAILSDPVRCGRNGWTSISTQNQWESDPNKVLLIDDMLQGFPDIIWLLFTAHQGLRVSWALSSSELHQHVEKLRANWKARDLRTVEVDSLKGEYQALLTENRDYLRSLWAEVVSQRSIEKDMDDKPDHDSFRL